MAESNTRIALITGASRGLGRSAALKLAEQGVDIILTYKDNGNKAQELVHEIAALGRSEEHTSELQSLMRISYAVFCLKKKNKSTITNDYKQTSPQSTH